MKRGAPSTTETWDAFFDDFYLRAMLTRAGFAETKCYGDLAGRPFGIDTRLVIAAQH